MSKYYFASTMDEMDLEIVYVSEDKLKEFQDTIFRIVEDSLCNKYTDLELVNLRFSVEWLQVCHYRKSMTAEVYEEKIVDKTGGITIVEKKLICFIRVEGNEFKTFSFDDKYIVNFDP